MITKYIQIFEALIEEFNKIAIATERDAYLRMLNEFKDNVNKALINSDWVELNQLTEEVSEEIGFLRGVIVAREEENESLIRRIVIAERLEIINDLMLELPENGIFDEEIEISVRLKGKLVTLMMQSEDAQFVKNAIDRIDAQIKSVIGFIESKRSQNAK